MDNVVNIIGTGVSYNDLTAAHLSLIDNADVLIGGKRHLKMFEEKDCEKIEIDKKISEISNFILSQKSNKKVVILASGDPLYYGIGSYLIKKIGKENINIHPNINSVSAAFSKIKEKWSDVKSISLHGRIFDRDFLRTFRSNNKIVVFTDIVNTPAAVSKTLLENGINWFKVCVFEKMGASDEKFEWYKLEEAVNKNFDELNIAVFISEEKSEGRSPYPGLPEDEYEHENGLITKSEVRAVTLSKLRLEDSSVFWDLGAGSGSVSVEAAFFISDGSIYSVEKNRDRVTQIKNNIKKFNCSNIEVKNLDLPEGISELPEPDRVFIGGGGKNLEKIVDESIKKLKKDGIIVINTVVLKSLETAVNSLKKHNMEPDVVQLSVSRGSAIAGELMLKSLNPVWIVTGKKE
ncbi:MAG: precorrin-6y C5,15-methyltransferase (decarboxylating) subunit CbiE [Deltaproteobacteria bacterium]|nr:precorrin-6y C5,15-methyltransferase (decarboxylating) subunit CbiE [Deltaproteobacteria bacterium]